MAGRGRILKRSGHRGRKRRRIVKYKNDDVFKEKEIETKVRTEMWP